MKTRINPDNPNERKCMEPGKVHWAPITDFSRNKLGVDGLNPICKIHRNARLTDKRRDDPEPYRQRSRDQRAADAQHYRDLRNARYHADPSRETARRRVRTAIEQGRLLPPRAVHCARNCGRAAEEYHHHHGYDEAHWLDVEPLCKPCHAIADQELNALSSPE